MSAGFRSELTLHDQDGRRIDLEDGMVFKLVEPYPARGGKLDVLVFSPDASVEDALVSFPLEGWFAGYRVFSLGCDAVLKVMGFCLVHSRHGNERLSSVTGRSVSSTYILRKI